MDQDKDNTITNAINKGYGRNHDKYMSDEIGEIITAMTKAIIEMHTPEKNCRGNRGSYANLESYLTSSKKILAKHGIFLHQHPRIKDRDTIMHSSFIHTSGQWLDSQMFANPAPDTNLPYHQAISSAFTYAKRLMLQSQLGLGADVTKKPDQKQITYKKDIAPKISSAQAKIIKDRCADKNININTITTKYKIEKIEDLTYQNYLEILKELAPR